MTTLVESPLPMDVPGTSKLASLPFRLDLSCPINLPSKPLSAGSGWPFIIAGPSRIPDEELDDFVRRRYNETLYLPEVFSPISGFAADLHRCRANATSPVYGDDGVARSCQTTVDLIKPLLLSLPQIERKHRRTVLPILSNTANTSSSSTKAAPPTAGGVQLNDQEKSVIRFSLDLRVGSRLAADDGVIPVPKRISDESEKRELLIQIIFLFLYMTSLPPSEGEQKSKKRKRRSHFHRHEPEATEPASPTEDPKMALELLIDRLSVWQAVADLDLDLNGDDAKTNASGGTGSHGNQRKQTGKGGDSAGVGALLGKFWKSVIMPFFVATQPELCATFHIKVFGHPIPPKLLPAPTQTQSGAGQTTLGSTTKKPRKPKITRPMPSNDDLLLPPPPVFGNRDRPRSTSYDKQKEYERERAMSRTSSRAGSRAPSDAGSRASPPPTSISASASGTASGAHMRRSLSRTSDSQSQIQTASTSASLLRRSRSRSIDPIARSESLTSVRNIGNASKKSLMRAPSGKDLFKSREVGLLRRTTSSTTTALTRKESLKGLGRNETGLSREDSQSQGGSSRFGLLGRKTSGGRETQSKGSGDVETQNPNTLILATPSKPRHTHAFFGTRTQSQPHFQAPGQSQYQHPYQYQNPNQNQPAYQAWPEQINTPGRERDGAGSGSASTSKANNARPAFIAETPANPSRIAKRDSGSYSNEDVRLSDDAGDWDGSDDPLGELWENTDDECDGDGDDDSRRRGSGSDGHRGLMVPETPMK
ncbi:hypothetical protein I316_07607 [Kwoniella heveanensis BCC8398]|uniref:DNA replication regulator Sld3 C-terminal domain-containing protein n=1 Tax=Kwoniella heveanensis BCC8398 TaxID=1296120 RepID=A0A1B9GIE6_9TREE|nr:hypothetical protein I316_07607 [Kwoniella heveanensis BCC8398]